MSKIWILISVIVILLIFQGCTSSRETTEYTAPNWTSDGKIVFIKDFNHIKKRHIMTDETNLEGSYEVLTLCEINSDGSGFKEIAEVARSEHHAFSIWLAGLSSAGDWVTFSMEDEGESEHFVYTMNRNGNNLRRVKNGQYPDFSPDASRIVYEKTDEGIWIMDRDGGNDHQLISDTDASSPAWSSDGDRIAFKSDSTYIVDRTGIKIRSYFRNLIDLPDWGPPDSNSICGSNGYSIVIINCESGVIDTLDITSTLGWGQGVKWSPNGEFFISADADGWFVIEENGTNKWYLQP